MRFGNTAPVYTFRTTKEFIYDHILGPDIDTVISSTLANPPLYLCYVLINGRTWAGKHLTYDWLNPARGAGPPPGAASSAKGEACSNFNNLRNAW